MSGMITLEHERDIRVLMDLLWLSVICVLKQHKSRP
jgi:hypothetical protein